MGQNEKPPRSGSCQLSPATDIGASRCHAISIMLAWVSGRADACASCGGAYAFERDAARLQQAGHLNNRAFCRAPGVGPSPARQNAPC